MKLDLTKNLKYDRLTKAVIKKAINSNSTCIDVGCHKGEIFDLFINQSPSNSHYGFEPIPELYNILKNKYSKHNIFNCALADEEGETTFQFVKNAPAYSGILKREYKVDNPEVIELKVPLKTLDSIIPQSTKIDFIKIDVEGGEFNVLKGAKSLLIKDKPTIIFEFGLGASNFYGSSPDKLFEYLSEIGYKISLLDKWLQNSNSLSKNEFKKTYKNNTEYYFIAYS